MSLVYRQSNQERIPGFMPDDVCAYLIHRKLSAENVHVRCGEYNAQKINERKPHQDRRAKQISIHPSFNSKSLYYDFALVHTQKDFVLDEHIFPICLPDQFGQLPSFDDEPCYAMGYGKDGYGKSKI